VASPFRDSRRAPLGSTVGPREERFMSKVIYALAAAALLSACVTPPRPTPVAVDTKKVLILAPQGVSAAKDTVGFNTLVKNVTQAFSSALSGELATKGYRSVNVLDQQPGLDAGQKMALYAAKNAAAKVAILTMETQSVGSDEQLQLRAQFIEGDLTPSNSAPTALHVRSKVEKSYLLRGSKSGDSTLTMSDLAKDFVDFLEASGRFKQ
jgi:hypothetical protein